MMMQPVIMPHSPRLTDRSVSWLLVMGRLSPGISIGQARAVFGALAQRSLLANVDAQNLGAVQRGLRTMPLAVESGAGGFSPYRGAFGQSLLTLMAAVGLVLLVVCANVANLILARGAARGREITVRLALGAGRRRLVQQLLSESLLLALAGGALGLVVAWWGSTLLLKLASGGPNPIPLVVSLDARLMAFCITVSVLTAILCGLTPALRTTRVDLTAALRGQGRGIAGEGVAPGRVPFGKALVAGQVALSLVLLVSAGMLVRSTRYLVQSDIGVARDRLVLARVDAERSGYSGPRLAALARGLTDRIAALPGVAAVSLSENGIFSGTESGTTISVEGFTAAHDEDTLVAYDDVGLGYFGAVGAHLLLGRDFQAGDNETGAKVAVLNETMARYFFPAGDAQRDGVPDRRRRLGHRGAGTPSRAGAAIVPLVLPDVSACRRVRSRGAVQW
jgi:predicted permease